jgi:orotidine 5'-phosphate decarboxylase subfamily 1
MSSSGSLATGAYTDKCVEMALKNKDFVLGFIGSRRFTEESDFIYMTPGVQLKEGTDSLGQQYRTPEMIVANNLSDVIIVGRGIYGSKNPSEAAREYRKRGWDAYLKRLSQ